MINLNLISVLVQFKISTRSLMQSTVMNNSETYLQHTGKDFSGFVSGTGITGSFVGSICLDSSTGFLGFTERFLLDLT